MKAIILALTLLFLPLTAFGELKVVPNEKVCMVTDAVFPKRQIEVKVDGKSYFGCCENCKKTLAEDPSSRTALDPVTKKPVDKANATIAVNEEGQVFYFESPQTMKKYKPN